MRTDSNGSPSLHNELGSLDGSSIQELNNPAAHDDSAMYPGTNPFLSVAINSYPCPAGTVCFHFYPSHAGTNGIDQIRTDNNKPPSLHPQLRSR